MGRGYPPQTAGLMGQIDYLVQQILRLHILGVLYAGLADDHRPAAQQALGLSVIQQDTALRHLQVHILIRMDFEELFHGHGESLLPVAP